MTALTPDMIEKARNGHLGIIQTIKDSLAVLPAGDAFRSFGGLVETYRGLHVRHTQAASLQAFARDRATFYHEIAPSGVPFSNAAPHVIGEGNQIDLHWRTRTSYAACLRDAKVWGYSAVIEAEGRVLFDFEDFESARIDDKLDFDPRVFRSEGRAIWYIDEAGRPPDITIDRAFSLLGPHSDAFGHWIWEYLPKLGQAIASGLPPPMKVLVEDFLPATHRQALRSMLPAGWEIFDVNFNQSVLVRQLWCAPSLVYMPVSEIPNEKSGWEYMASPADRYLRAIAAMSAGLPAGAERGARIYLSRHNIKRRKLVNSNAIESLCRTLGFQVFNPEELSFDRQVSLIRSARHIVAPEGSATLLCYFARPNTKLCMLSHPDTIGQATLTSVLDGLGVETTIFTGPYAKLHPVWRHFSDYRIDAEALSRFLDDWLGGG